MRTALVAISAIYLARGLLIIPVAMKLSYEQAPFDYWSSVIVLIYGLVYAVGTWKAWPSLSPNRKCRLMSGVEQDDAEGSPARTSSLLIANTGWQDTYVRVVASLGRASRALQPCSSILPVIPDPADFGRIMATAVQDGARAYAEEWGIDGNVALNPIFQALYKHLTDPQESAKETRVRILGHE